jgi:hypothetical protein
MNKRVFYGLLWFLIILVAASLYFYMFWKSGKEQEHILLEDDTRQVEPSMTTEEHEDIPLKQDEPDFIISDVASPPDPVPVDPCVQLKKDVDNFFTYLNSKSYVRMLLPKTDVKTRFIEILKKLIDSPPLPAENTSDHEHMIRNITHFFRVLEKKDFQLIKAIINNEHETFEVDIKMFYMCLSLTDCCADQEGLKLSMASLYPYAGFFLNTIGGRACLFRRASNLRLLVSYYSLLVLQEADKKGENRCGLDVFPHIAPVKNEITNYPAFQFKQEYVEQINRVENYYKKKRSAMP